MKERPIIFSTEMVKAILSGHKTMTRRIAKQKPLGHGTTKIEFPIYAVLGDLLWVRETWNCFTSVYYKADEDEDTQRGAKWAPSIHMPKGFARIWLEVTEIKIEKLHQITVEDAISEGIKFTSLLEI